MAQRRGTGDAAYARYLETTQTARWKRWLDVQRPYRWHVRRLSLGFVLDLGCGIGATSPILAATAWASITTRRLERQYSFPLSRTVG